MDNSKITPLTVMDIDHDPSKAQFKEAYEYLINKIHVELSDFNLKITVREGIMIEKITFNLSTDQVHMVANRKILGKELN